jgi:hypothetical protein
MAELPDITILDRSDGAEWRYRAIFQFRDELITLDLRAAGELRPTDPGVIEATLRNQLMLANDRDVLDQVRHRAREPILLYFFE